MDVIMFPNGTENHLIFYCIQVCQIFYNWVEKINNNLPPAGREFFSNWNNFLALKTTTVFWFQEISDERTFQALKYI